MHLNMDGVIGLLDRLLLGRSMVEFVRVTGGAVACSQQKRR